MPKNKHLKGKQVPIIQDEIDHMVSLFRQGKNWGTIGHEVGRHWQTVSKYVRNELAKREGEDLRREALRHALLQHHQDFPPVLEKLRGRWTLPSLGPREQHRGVRVRESPPALSRRDHLLLQEFRTGHTKASPLWGWVNAWEAKIRAFQEGKGRLEGWLRERVEQEVGCLAGVKLTAIFVPLLLQHALLRGTGEGEVPGELVVSEGGKGRQAHWGKNLMAAGDGDLRAAAALFSKLREQVENHHEVQSLGSLYQEMKSLLEKIEEEIEVLALRRAYPGRCRLCPV